MTKRYYANDQLLATRLGDETLYHVLNDPTGLSLTMVDGNGTVAGRVLYNGFGSVLDNTLPISLTGSLLGHPDAATGLVHMGDGRWLDTALGRPLQPNANGGPPTVPQALNRFAAAPLGQPGVADAATTDSFNWTPHMVGLAKNTAVEAARVLPVVKGYTYTGIRRVAVRGSYETLSQGLPQALQQFPGRFVGNDLDGSLFYLTQIQVEAQSVLGIGVAARNTARELTNALPDGSLVQVRGGLDGDYAAHPVSGYLDEVARLNGIRAGLGIALDFGIGFAFQYIQDSQNPYLTPAQTLSRSAASGFGGALSSGVATVVACGLSGGIICVVVAGTLGGVGWAFLQPVVFDTIPGFQPARQLKPLQVN